MQSSLGLQGQVSRWPERTMTRLNFFQSSAWVIDNLYPHQSQQEGRSGGSTLQWKNITYLQYFTPISVSLAANWFMDIHAPVSFPRLNRNTWGDRGFPVISFSIHMVLVFFQIRISNRSSFWICVWFPENKYGCPRRVTTRWPVITHEVIHWCGVEIFRYGSVRPTCFTRSILISHTRIDSSDPWNSTGINSSYRDLFTGPHFFTYSGVMCCTKAHSYWRDFCIS